VRRGDVWEGSLVTDPTPYLPLALARGPVAVQGESYVIVDPWLTMARQRGVTEAKLAAAAAEGEEDAMTTPTYDTDFYQWTQTQAAALRAKDWPALDLDNLAEEIESLGRSDRRAITHQLERGLIHLLKWVYQSSQRARYGRSWRRSIRQARHAIAKLIEESPSLHDYPARQLVAAYRYARQQAAEETGLPLATFPEACPWPLAQVLDEDFWPEPSV
jgi:hypothetical protein